MPKQLTRNNNWISGFHSLSLIILLLISSRYLIAAGKPNGSWSTAFYITAYLGQVTIITSLFCGLIPWLIQKLTRHATVSKVIAGFIGFLLTLFVLIDTVVYAQYSFHINGIILQMVFNKDAADVFQFKTSVWIIFFVIAIGIALLQLLLLKLAPKWQAKLAGKWRITTVAILLCCYLFSQCTHAWFIAVEYGPVIRYSTMMPFYEGATAMGFFRRHHLISNEDIQRHHNTVLSHHAHLHYPLHPIQSQQKQPLNILMIVIDTWRADMFDPRYAPAINQFSKKASVYLNHYSGGDCTQPGIFTLFYSLPPSYWWPVLETKTPPVLMDMVKRYHYNSGIFGSAGLTTPPFFSTVFANIPHIELNTPGSTPWQRDININKRMLAFLTQQQHAKHPFFGFLFYDAVHGFSVPPHFPKKYSPSGMFNYATLNNNSDRTPYFNLYKDASLFDDQLVKQILDKVDTLGLLKNTVIIITADHGEEFNDAHHNHWGHGSDFSDTQLKTPMIIYWPNQKPKIYHHMTTHYDVAPTLLTRIFHVSNPIIDYSIGHLMNDTHAKKPFLMVGSYQRQGIVTPNLIVSYLKTGGYITTDRQLNTVTNQAIPMNILAKAFEYRTRYTRKRS